jgi:hypothetical protein
MRNCRRLYRILCVLSGIALPAMGQLPDTTSYFPLARGNRWQYHSTDFIHTATIADTVHRNGHIYFDYEIEEQQQHYYFRENNHQVLLWHAPDSSEIVVYDFTATVGDTWTLPADCACDLGNAITLADTQTTVETPMDTFSNCMRFVHQQSCVDAGRWETWFAPGIGPVQYRDDYFVGAQLFQLTDVSIVTGIENSSAPHIPQSFQLQQNYPNPFNPVTKIKYSVPYSTLISLKVYNLLGQEVAILVEGKKQVGTYTVFFDGSGLSSGVYYYRLETNEFTNTKKLLLLK